MVKKTPETDVFDAIKDKRKTDTFGYNKTTDVALSPDHSGYTNIYRFTFDPMMFVKYDINEFTKIIYQIKTLKPAEIKSLIESYKTEYNLYFDQIAAQLYSLGVKDTTLHLYAVS